MLGPSYKLSRGASGGFYILVSLNYNKIYILLYILSSTCAKDVASPAVSRPSSSTISLYIADGYALRLSTSLLPRCYYGSTSAFASRLTFASALTLSYIVLLRLPRLYLPTTRRNVPRKVARLRVACRYKRSKRYSTRIRTSL